MQQYRRTRANLLLETLYPFQHSLESLAGQEYQVDTRENLGSLVDQQVLKVHTGLERFLEHHQNQLPEYLPILIQEWGLRMAEPVEFLAEKRK